jgi:phosphohistidine phosphatase
MKRRVTLLRHGHAEEHPHDFARLLSDAGRAAAARAGEALKRAGWTPDHLLASSAPRALATAELVARACGYSAPIRAERILYLASDEQCRDALRQSPEHTRSVLVVGHNPGLSRLARDLCGHPSELMPAEFASVELDLTDWIEL